ncbi:MAG: diguanylate cyclase domain-containing protein [Desulfobulbaceae bacterium]
MKSKSKNLKKTVADKNASLGSVINRNEKIKETVKEAANELTSVNEVLKQGKEVKIPVQIIKEAITQNKEVEYKVAKAADDLHQVNTELAKEVAERLAIETELSDMKNDLADVRDDLSMSQAKEEESRKVAFHDALTGLPNRLLFEEHLDHGLTQAKRHGWKLAVLFMDVDNFKNINDSYGHDLGDKVLLTVAERLRSAIRSEDTVSRWGGDEFACLLLEVKQEADVVHLAESIVQQISESFKFKGTVLSIRVSIGIAIYPADGETADILFKNADTAMYKAKGTERRVVLFRDAEDQGVRS